jgi:hypothetical protein
MPQLSKEIVLAAIDGFESQKQRIDAQIAELRAMMAGASAKETTPERATRQFSPDTLRRMKEGQKRRWAKVKEKAQIKPEAKPKRKLSAAGKAAIVAALKKRWAAKKAQSKTAS